MNKEFYELIMSAAHTTEVHIPHWANGDGFRLEQETAKPNPTIDKKNKSRVVMSSTGLHCRK